MARSFPCVSRKAGGTTGRRPRTRERKPPLRQLTCERPQTAAGRTGGILDGTRDFEALFEAHRARILGYAARRAPFEDAKDVVAETFLVAWRRRGAVPDDPLPWLFSVARNVLATRSRSAQRRAQLQARLELENANPTTTPQGERRELVAAFMELNEKDRELLMLVAWDGLTNEQAAASLGWSPSRFSVRLHRARRRLAARMDDAGEAPFPNTRIHAAEETR